MFLFFASSVIGDLGAEMSEDRHEAFLSVEEMVARYKGKIKKGTLANWRSHHKGPPHIKLEGRVLYPLALVQDWERRQYRRHV